VTTKIYVEGGGHRSRTIAAACRAGFGKYFEKVVPVGAMPRIVACGSRSEAYRDFLKGLDDPKYERVLLLVDAEAEVAGGDAAWTHLQKRDGWAKPDGVQDDSAHLMVQCMESWFLADKESLAGYYGQGFNMNALPGRKEIELIPKTDVQAALDNATRQTQKGAYHKTRHGFNIMAAIDPNKVEAVSDFARRLHKSVQE